MRRGSWPEWLPNRSETKRSEIQVYFFFALFAFFPFFAFCRFFRFFSRFFFVSLRFFHLIFSYFTFVFASDFWCFASKWIMWNQDFFSLPSEAKFLLQFQILLPKRKWGRTLVYVMIHRGDLAEYTATKIPLCILIMRILRPQSQFPHSCVCERFIYSQDQSTYFLQQNRQINHENI